MRVNEDRESSQREQMTAGGRPHAKSRHDLSDLLDQKVLRWTLNRKMRLLDAIEAGEFSLQDAASAFAVNEDELRSWKKERRAGTRVKRCGCVLPDGQCSRCCILSPKDARAARKSLGWTFESAAEHTGLSLRSIVRFEAGHYLTKKSVDLLVAAFRKHGVDLTL